MKELKPIRVLVVDDSAIVRKLLSEALAREPDIEVIGTAPDPYVARDKILALRPDVLTLDIEMPKMDGLSFLEKLMRHHPLPVIIISSLGTSSSHAAMRALQAGAVEVLAKPAGPYSVGDLQLSLAQKVRAAAAAKLRPQRTGADAASPAERKLSGPAPLFQRLRVGVHDRQPPAVIAIGASTGGTEAIQGVLMQLPAECPAILIAQHIPAGFSRAFADRLNQLCAMEVKEAADGDLVRPGRALVAPGNFHMVLRKQESGYVVSVKNGPLVCYQRPSVDVLFQSVAETVGPCAVGVLLTGMGADGARGLLKMKEAGAKTIAQDEASCVVFGMPREAIRLNAAGRVLPLSVIPAAIAGC